MVWFQVNIPLVLGCLLMAALMDLRVFKLGLLVASILLMLSATGMILFGTKLGIIPANAVTVLRIIPANAVAVLSVMVWLACVVSAIRSWFHSKRPYDRFGTPDHTATGEMADGAWMLNPTTRRLTGQIASEFHFNKLISGPSGSTLYGVVMGEAGLVGPVQLVRLHEQGGRVPLARAFDPGILQIAIGPVTKIPVPPLMPPSCTIAAFLPSEQPPYARR